MTCKLCSVLFVTAVCAVSAGFVSAVSIGKSEATTSSSVTEVPTAASASPMAIDAVHSSVIFRIKHMGVAYFYGRFNEITGSFSFDPAKPDAGTFEISISAESVDTNNGKRDQHLRGPDFFNTKEFPTITFKSKSIKPATGNNMFELTGDLTFHGVTKPVTAALEFVGTASGQRGTKMGFDAKFTIKRSDFGINYMPDGLGDEVMVMVGLEGGSK